jgi:hypothetical protein
MAEPSNLFWYSSVTVQILFCAHLLWTGLAKKHPIFTSYLACSVLRSLGAFYFTAGFGSVLPLSYTYFWLWSEPVLLLLQIAVTLEVHSGMWKEYAHVVRPARPVLFFLLLTAIVFAAVPVKAELSQFGNIQLQVVLQFEFMAKRYISTVLALFLGLSALLFLIVVRNSVKSNLLRHESMLAAYFGIYAVCYFAVNMGWAKKTLTNNYMLSALTLCLVIWISVFRPGPELAHD